MLVTVDVLRLETKHLYYPRGNILQHKGIGYMVDFAATFYKGE